ncbi:MAG: M1 family metallopeptidase [Cytophagaceae bacterium]|jgi:aminopeptidase N|nr:M1 family metallopeptidase [Cytophagaceae bacterium]
MYATLTNFRILFLFACVLSGNLFVCGQTWTAQAPGTHFRSTKNPFYWKNKKPRENYWQQDVHYQIDAYINDTSNSIECSKFVLTYWNNSPDTLTELFFHLYENAFQPGSYYHDLCEHNDMEVKFGEKEKAGLGTEVRNLKVNGESVSTQLDNTILKVQLNKPLLPSDSLLVECTFTTWWDIGDMRRRNKFYETIKGKKHFNGVHWYPIVCVYDAKFGWTTDQHLDKEFYADFGTFDVSLTFPQEYIVDATGILVNQEEVLPAELRRKIDLKNFNKRIHPDSVSVPVERRPGAFKTWKFHADNVHNFAFTADPLYRIGERIWNGIQVISLAQEQNAYGWQQSAWFTEQVIKTYSQDFGMYAWPKIIVADADDGMEYPMLTLDRGTYPSHQGLLAHEVGHMWYYGMIGSNETYRAFLDEGFTQFLTVWSQDKILGAVRDRIGNNKYIDRFVDSSNTQYENLYYPYLNHVVENYDEPLNTHSSAFNGALRHGGNYGLVYYKTGVMLYNLKYVLGDELFSNAMKYYFDKWKFCHPYPEDFRQTIIEYTKVDLNWFFDQWLETTKYIDYGIKSVKRKRGHSCHDYSITLERKGRMQMPIDLVIRTNDSSNHYYHIPNTWFIKKTTANILPKWYGWDLLKPTYSFSVSLPSPIQSVSIDPSLQLADKDLRNNFKGKTNFRQWQWDHKIGNLTRWDRQRNFLRPAVWYNGRDGMQLGVRMEGSYIGHYSYNFSIMGNSTLLHQESQDYTFFMPASMYAQHRHSTHNFWRHTWAGSSYQYYAGLAKAEPFLEKIFRKQDQRNPRFQRLLISMRYWLPASDANDYQYQPWWEAGKINGSINAQFTHYYVYEKGRGEMTLAGRSSSFFSDYSYAWVQMKSTNRWTSGKIWEFKSRLLAQAPWSGSQYPLASALGVADANGEETADHKLIRASGIIPNEWIQTNATGNLFHASGGLMLRGYTGRMAYSDGSFSPIGYGGAAWNMEIEFDKLVKWTPKKWGKYIKLDTYLFADAGILNTSSSLKSTYWTTPLADAGLGVAFTFKWPPYTIQPVTLRVETPSWISHPASGENAFAPRLIIGLGRTF